MRTFGTMLVAVLLLTGFCSCEKMILDDDPAGSIEPEGNVVIRANVYDIVPLDKTRAGQLIGDYCTKLCFVVFEDGVQKKKILQKKGDDGFGQVSTTLPEGNYQLLVLAHSSTSNPSLAKPDFIQFKNADGFSDTFYYYGNLVVAAEPKTYDVTMQRATSMLRVIITGQLPAELSRIRVYYTGESGVFNAVEGWGGSVNSKQYIFYDVAEQAAPLTLEAYTFLRDDLGSLDVTLTAYDAKDYVIAERTLENIPMKNRMVTEYSGALFSSSSVNELGFTFTGETDWEVYQHLSD